MIFIAVYIVVAILFSVYMVSYPNDTHDVAISCIFGMFWPFFVPVMLILWLVQSLAKLKV